MAEKTQQQIIDGLIARGQATRCSRVKAPTEYSDTIGRQDAIETGSQDTGPVDEWA